MSKISPAKCWRCQGDKSFWICDVNPFAAGGWNAIRAMRKIEPCYECNGTGQSVTRPHQAPIGKADEN